MEKFWTISLISGLALLSGCATTDDRADSLPSGAPQISYAQVKATPESYSGQSVTFGGKVLGARRLKEGTRIEILQLPLTSSLQPTMDLSRSEGRFVALQKDFLDPATVPPGTFLTVTGAIAGTVVMPLDETEYTYPLVHITNLRVWTEDEEAPRIRRPIGPGPYWGPYWSPYWHPWPYYW
ncbi:MAG: Slp family lipoprotein [Nitrospira sp.]|nr:Slp family lipoprotein [Nitrospira sp.]MDH4368269.1 Slp family lipoprotein [Nitrospira sp.]MDH5346324.1 Slp family lipoprotein [Nitrospira sp.]MDH5495823.1 Slp family lipoprotein [Nitrospira sp.]MDH5725579.1 Slp family lipoprotein [Nitrospira sp.]